MTTGSIKGHITVDLYRKPGISVTTESFTVGTRRFPIEDLADLRTARGPHDRLTVRAVAVTGTVLGGLGLVLGYSGGLYHLTAVAYLTLGIAAFVPILLAVAGHRLRPPAYELWGCYQGVTMLLFSSDQEREFGQVTRALLRAREAARFGGLAAPLASTEPWRPMPR
ncbi:DUF6232 family protein [Micromonospora sp. NPDC049559]|uniref:DUF6232 family protein n=1 Tax=Micromonospora sp. NPDC049559 TaxID=3155923 RepID=UPI003433B307